MVKKLIRIIVASSTSGVVIMEFIKMGFKLNILETVLQSNVCIISGIILILILNLQILMEKEGKLL